MKQSGLRKNLVLSTFYQILTMVLPLITAPYASRVLGVEGIGIYSYTYSYVMYFMLLAALGVVSYGSREIARHRDCKKERSKDFWEIVVLVFISSLVTILIWGIWVIFNANFRIYYCILTVYLLGTMFDISWFYVGMEELKYTVCQNSIFKIVGTVSIFLFVEKSEDLWIYILILALSFFLANVSMWFYLPRFINCVPLKEIRLKKHFMETLVYFLPTIATSVYTIMDKTLIGLITRDASENGNYEQATKIINIAKSICFAGVNLVLSSRISYLFAQKKFEEIKQRIIVSMDYILFIGLAICFGIIGVAERFVPLFFGPGYEKTILLLICMAPLVAVIGISNCIGSHYYTPAGLRAKSAKYILMGAVVNLVLNLILIPQLKSVGAVVASLIAEIVITSLYLYSCDGYYRISMLLTQSWKKVLAGVLMLFIVYFIGNFIENIFTAITLQIVIGVFFYFSFLLICKDSFMKEVAIPQMKFIYKKMLKKRSRL